MNMNIGTESNRYSSSLTPKFFILRMYVSHDTRSRNFKKGEVTIVVEMQSTKQNEFEPGVRELAPEEIEVVTGGAIPGTAPQPVPNPVPCPH
jgi:hypothetical protein